jgi:translocation and assembly module TamA
MQDRDRPQNRARARRCRALALCLLAGALGSSALHGGRAADPQPYSVAITPTGNGAIDQAIHDAATLIALQKTAAVGPFALLARARADADRFATVLDSFGYYGNAVRIAVAGRDIADPDLPAALDATEAGTEVPVTVAVTLGKLFHLGRVDLTGDVPDSARAAFALRAGAPAVAADVIAARDKLLASLRATGHALAKVADPVATLHPGQQTLDIAIAVQAGPRVALGPIAIDGLQRSNEDFVRRRLQLHPGEMFDPAKIEAARQDLASVGAFSSVRIDAADALDANGTLPMDVRIAERKLRNVSLSAAWSTDLGGNASAVWTHRNLFGNAEQLTLTATTTNLGGTAARAPGYRVAADLALPDWQRRDQTLAFDMAGFDETLQAYARRGVQAGTTLSRKLSHELTASVGAELIETHIVQEDAGRDYLLLQVPLTLGYDTTNGNLDPVRGVKAKLSVTPTRSLLQPAADFVIAQASGSTYLDVGSFVAGTAGRSVVAARALVGSVQGASTFAIPPDQRFYAGGGGSVRGFRFQSVGPKFADGNPIGGTSVDVGSVELRQRFGASYGAVAFVDAGQVGSNGVPFEGAVHVGAGVGARYYTSFGPVRLDFAMPVTREQGGDKFEVYIGIGQSF